MRGPFLTGAEGRVRGGPDTCDLTENDSGIES